MLKDTSSKQRYKELVHRLIGLALSKGYKVSHRYRGVKSGAWVNAKRLILSLRPYSRSYLFSLAHEVGHIFTSKFAPNAPLSVVYTEERMAWNWATLSIYAQLTPQDRVRYQKFKTLCLKTYEDELKWYRQVYSNIGGNNV